MSRIIWVVTPIVGGDFRADESLGSLGSPGTEIRQVHVERGPASIESEFDAALAAPWVVARAIEAQTAGAHAVVIDCMDDPGLEAAREAVSIPVLGPCQTTMHVAGLLGHRFSVVTTQARAVPGFENRAAWYGVRDRLASVRWVDIPVLDLAKDGDGLAARLAQESAAAVTRDGAHVVILGCTGMLGLAGALLIFYLGTASVGTVVDIGVAVQIIIAAVLGGRRTILGAALGAIFLIVAGEYLRPIGELSNFVVSALALAVLLFVPDGFLGYLMRRRRGGER